MDGRGDTKAPKDAPTIDNDDAVDQRLGETVRLLRQRAGLSIQDVANKTGLSNGMISQLERARAMPSIRTLRLLSIALEVPISYFFETSDPAADVQRYIVRKNNRRLLRLTASGVVKEALTPEGTGQLELYELTLNPGASSGTDFLQHTGEKAGYILSGSLRLWLDNQAHVLEAGDSFRFPSIVPHMFDNPTQQAARVIWVTTLRQTDSPAS
jgi:transcriptional regulator with XRE-family HTH domain